MSPCAIKGPVRPRIVTEFQHSSWTKFRGSGQSKNPVSCHDNLLIISHSSAFSTTLKLVNYERHTSDMTSARVPGSMVFTELPSRVH